MILTDELIRVTYDKEQRPAVTGRDLHEALGIRTAYKDWFPRMCEYGFRDGVDFNPLKKERVQMEGGRAVMREVTDHILTIEMAKEICMIQRSDIGKKFREYFLEIERKWNSPEAVMARALQFAQNQLALLTEQNSRLLETTEAQAQQIAEMEPKATYYDMVLACPDAVPITILAKDYGWSAQQMNKYLHKKGVQYKLQNTWLLYAKYQDKGYVHSETYPYAGRYGEVHNRINTKWTQTGRLFIYDLMKADGYLPIVERQACGGI